MLLISVLLLTLAMLFGGWWFVKRRTTRGKVRFPIKTRTHAGPSMRDTLERRVREGNPPLWE